MLLHAVVGGTAEEGTAQGRWSSPANNAASSCAFCFLAFSRACCSALLSDSRVRFEICGWGGSGGDGGRGFGERVRTGGWRQVRGHRWEGFSRG